MVLYPSFEYGNELHGGAGGLLNGSVRELSDEEESQRMENEGAVQNVKKKNEKCGWVED